MLSAWPVFFCATASRPQAVLLHFRVCVCHVYLFYKNTTARGRKMWPPLQSKLSLKEVCSIERHWYHTHHMKPNGIEHSHFAIRLSQMSSAVSAQHILRKAWEHWTELNEKGPAYGPLCAVPAPRAAQRRRGAEAALPDCPALRGRGEHSRCLHWKGPKAPRGLSAWRAGNAGHAEPPFGKLSSKFKSV